MNDGIPVVNFDGDGPVTDGTLAGALESLSGSILDLDQGAEPPSSDGGNVVPLRGEDGRFQPKPAERDVLEPVVDGLEDDAGDDAFAGDDDSVEDYVELPPAEDGGDPVRVPLSELLAARDRIAGIEAEFEQVRAETLPPDDVVRATMEAHDARQQYLELAQQLERHLMPRQPSLSMLDDTSPYYDPSAYYHAVQDYNSRLQEFHQWRQRTAAERERHAHADRTARDLRLRQVRAQVPEIRTDAGYMETVKAVSDAFGLSPEELSSVTDPRAWKIITYALKGQAAEKAAGEARRVADAKPRLVRPKGRSAGQPGRQSVAAAIRQAGNQPGGLTFDEAAAAIGGLTL